MRKVNFSKTRSFKIIDLNPITDISTFQFITQKKITQKNQPMLNLTNNSK